MESFKMLKPLPNFELLYEIDEDGRFFSLRRGRLLKSSVNNAGYLCIGLWVNSEITNFLVHRAVAETFVPNPHNKPVVNHKDGNRLNNHYSNLEWVTSAENTQHAIKNGISFKRKTGDAKGEGHHASKFKDYQIREIREQYNKHKNASFIARQYNVSTNTIYRIVTGRAWVHIK